MQSVLQAEPVMNIVKKNFHYGNLERETVIIFMSLRKIISVWTANEQELRKKARNNYVLEFVF